MGMSWVCFALLLGRPMGMSWVCFTLLLGRPVGMSWVCFAGHVIYVMNTMVVIGC